MVRAGQLLSKTYLLDFIRVVLDVGVILGCDSVHRIDRTRIVVLPLPQQTSPSTASCGRTVSRVSPSTPSCVFPQASPSIVSCGRTVRRCSPGAGTTRGSGSICA